MRYKITVVAPATAANSQTVLLVPFKPDALVIALIEDLFKRVQRIGLPLTPGTHVATLHINSESGPVLDCEDILSDVVTESESEQLFAVFKPSTEASAVIAVSRLAMALLLLFLTSSRINTWLMRKHLLDLFASE